MASDQSFADYATDQIKGAGRVSSRKMFGEYAIYCDEKVVALLCDNQLYMRPTTGGRAFIGRVTEGSPFPGAKAHFLVTDQLDDREWLTELVVITARELPVPKPKKPKEPTRPAKPAKSKRATRPNKKA